MCNNPHHSYSCRCGFGGEGHLGRRGADTYGTLGTTQGLGNTFQYLSEDTPHSQAENICRPGKCPVCGEEVFFVRYNGGSVWFDELGKPWLKHGCFTDTEVSGEWSGGSHWLYLNRVVAERKLEKIRKAIDNIHSAVEAETREAYVARMVERDKENDKQVNRMIAARDALKASDSYHEPAMQSRVKELERRIDGRDATSRSEQYYVDDAEELRMQLLPKGVDQSKLSRLADALTKATKKLLICESEYLQCDALVKLYEDAVDNGAAPPRFDFKMFATGR